MAAEPQRGPVGSRLETLEAMALLCLARMLVGFVRFQRWRAHLGPVASKAGTGGAQRIDRHFARVVQRALDRLPLHFKCLPQAMALHWMLQRRRRPSQIVIAALPRAARVGRDDLHAWSEVGGEVLIGQSNQAHQSLIRFGYSEV